MSDTLLSYPNAAAKLGVSQMTVRRMVASGKLRTVRIGVKRVFIVGEDIEKVMRPAPKAWQRICKTARVAR